MKKLFTLDNAHTLICHLFSPRNVDEAITEAQAAAQDGADAIAVELCKLEEQYRNGECFARIINAVDLPFMFLDYRNDIYGWNDEQRINMLIEAAKAGAGMIDVVGDLFDKSPDERTTNPDAIARQKEVIDKLHSLGSQVIMSSHPQRCMTTAEVTAQLKDFANRGADVVKLVARTDTAREYLDSLGTSISLYRNLSTPFVYICSGAYARLQRMTSMSLGGSITFGVHEYHDFAPYNQPKITDFVAVRKGIGIHLKEL